MRTVFHHSDPAEHEHVLANAANLLADDTVDVDDVVVVANASGVRLLLADGEHEERVADLVDDGVTFVACRNSLERRDYTPDDLTAGVDTARSGVGELTRRQSAGYAYVKP